jgi:hypothetical protein
VVGWSKRLHQSQHPSGSAWGWICKKDNGGERRILVLTIGDGEPSILLLDFDFVPLVLALCVHRLVCFLLRGLHNLSLRLPLLGRGRAHISAACSRRRPAVDPVCADAENNLLANTSTRLQGNTSSQLVRRRMSLPYDPDSRAAAALQAAVRWSCVSIPQSAEAC